MDGRSNEIARASGFAYLSGGVWVIVLAWLSTLSSPCCRFLSKPVTPRMFAPALFS